MREIDFDDIRSLLTGFDLCVWHNGLGATGL